MEYFKDFTATGTGNSLKVHTGDSLKYDVAGTFVGTIKLEVSRHGGHAWDTVATLTAAGSGTVKNEGASDAQYRFNCTAYTSGTINTNLRDAETAVAGAGSKAGAKVTVTESSAPITRQTVLKFTDLPLSLSNASGSAQAAGSKIYDFPEGRILILGATGYCAETTTSALASTLNASSTCKWGVGTTTGVNSTLATTEQDILPATNITSSSTINVAGATSNAALAASAQFDGTATAKSAYLNFSVPTDTDLDANATITLTGQVTITWINLGDY